MFDLISISLSITLNIEYNIIYCRASQPFGTRVPSNKKKNIFKLYLQILGWENFFSITSLLIICLISKYKGIFFFLQFCPFRVGTLTKRWLSQVLKSYFCLVYCLIASPAYPLPTACIPSGVRVPQVENR